MLPSGPTANPLGELACDGMLYSLIACVVGLIIPTALVLPLSGNQMLPSGPARYQTARCPG